MKFQSKCPNCGYKRKLKGSNALYYGRPEEQDGAYIYVKADKPTGRHIIEDAYCPNCGHRETYEAWEPK